MYRLLDFKRYRPHHLSRPMLVLVLFTLVGCEKVREYVDLPFLPQSEYVYHNGRRMHKDEIAYYEKLKANLDARFANSNDAMVYNNLGELYMEKGGYETAKDMFLEATKLDPTLSSAHHNLGILTLKEGFHSDASRYFERALRLSPDDATIWYNFGQAHYGLLDSQNALRAFNKAIELDNELVPAYLEKARTLFRERRFAEAEASCRAAMANIPKVTVKAQAEEKAGGNFVSRWISGRIKKATTKDDKSLKSSPEAEIAYNLALTLKAQRRFQDAILALGPAERLPIARADALLLKAQLQEQAGDRNSAIATLELLRSENPELAEAPKRIARIYELTGQQDKAFQMRLIAADLDFSDKKLQLDAARDARSRNDNARLITVYERLVRLEPENTEFLLTLAEAYERSGITRQAAFMYQRAVNLNKNDLKLRRKLGLLYADLPRFHTRALLNLDKYVLRENPNDVEARIAVGELYLNTRNLPEAEKHLRWASELDRKNARIHLALARLYVEMKRNEDAAAQFRLALQDDPESPQAHFELARALRSVNRLEEAVGPMETFLAKMPDDLEARRFYADLLRDMNRREDAVHQYKEIVAKKPNDISTLLELAKLATMLGQLDDAAGMYESLLEKNPTHLVALRSVGQIYDRQKKPLRSMFAWQRVLKLKPEDLEAQSQLANAYRSIGDDEAAIARYEELGATGDAEAWRNAAFLHLKRSNLDPKAEVRAVEAYRKVIALNRRDVQAREALAGILRRSNNPQEIEEAIQLYRELLQLDARDLKSRLNLANLLNQTDRLPDALNEYDLILQADDKNIPALVGKGVALRKRGRFRDAARQYELALKIDPNSKDAHYNLALLYDFYLDGDGKDNALKASIHYGLFVKNGGNPQQVPKAVFDASMPNRP